MRIPLAMYLLAELKELRLYPLPVPDQPFEVTQDSLEPPDMKLQCQMSICKDRRIQQAGLPEPEEPFILPE